MTADRYTAKRWCRECQCETTLDLVVEPDAILAQCMSCLASFELPRVPPNGEHI